jgi:hypothetical protein
MSGPIRRNDPADRRHRTPQGSSRRW